MSTGDIFMILLKLKMAATDQLHNFCGSKNFQVTNYLNVTITFPTLWRSACDFKIY